MDKMLSSIFNGKFNLIRTHIQFPSYFYSTLAGRWWGSVKEEYNPIYFTYFHQFCSKAIGPYAIVSESPGKLAFGDYPNHHIA